MRLVSCYISSFGRIKNYQHDFNQGLNTILQDNGWGKSTFSAYIKAMLYGMEYSPRKKELLDRNHYLPWDGSACGGNLIIETNGKMYRINRTFGKTDKDDTFSLIDMSTGLESADFDEHIGEKLFQVDRESFEKTIYLPQGSLATGMTDSINAKMGGLSEAKDDIKNFDSALKIIKEAKSEYTKNSKQNPGKLTVHKQQMLATKQKLERLNVVSERYDSLMDMLKLHTADFDKLQSDKSVLAGKIEEQSKREQLLGSYRTLQESLSVEMSELEKAGAVLEQADEHGFSKNILTEEDFASLNEDVAYLSELRAKVASAKMQQEDTTRLEELNRFFARGIPSKEELSSVEKLSMDITRLEGQIARLKDNLAETKAQKKADDRVYKQKSPIGKILSVVMLIGFVVAGGAFVALAQADAAIGYGFWALALADMIYIVMSSAKQKATRNAEAENYDRTIDELNSEIDRLEEESSQKRQVCEEFLSDYLVKRTESYTENIYDIRHKLDMYEVLVGQEKMLSDSVKLTIDELTDKKIQLSTRLQPFTTSYGVDLYETSSEFDFIIRLKADIDAYNMALARKNDIAGRVELIKSQIEDFKNSNDMSVAEESVAELQERLRVVDESIVEQHKLILKDQDDIRAVEEELEELTELADSMDAMEAHGEELKYRARLIEKTLELLQQSRENFLSKYISPLKDSLHDYLGLIDGGSELGYEIQAYDIDLDLNVKVDYQGNMMGLEYLSEGYKDLVGLCSRMAMIDVLYQNESPVIIMDDPFVNLDEDKLKAAMKLIEEIAEKKQVIYFTCHKSRVSPD